VRIRPVVVSRPLVDVVAEIKRHNASTLAKIYPVSSSSKASDSDATSGDELEVGEPEIDPFKDNEAKRVESEFWIPEPWRQYHRLHHKRRGKT
jgi:hypothetical protein